MDFYYLERQALQSAVEAPLLVMLHGYGSNEEDLFSFMGDLPEGWHVLSLRAPEYISTGGYGWFDLDWMNEHQKIDTEQAVKVLRELMHFIQTYREERMLTGPTHLLGFSQGGMLCYAMALSYPQYFSKVAILSAYPEPALLQQVSRDKKALSKLDFFISHGMEDGVIPLDMAREAAPLLEELGVLFTFREYMSGHAVNAKNYLDLMNFFNKTKFTP